MQAMVAGRGETFSSVVQPPQGAQEPLPLTHAPRRIRLSRSLRNNKDMRVEGGVSRKGRGSVELEEDEREMRVTTVTHVRRCHHETQGYV